MYIPNEVVEQKVIVENNINEKFNKLNLFVLANSKFLDLKDKYNSKLFKIRILTYINKLAELNTSQQEEYLGKNSKEKIEVLKKLPFYKQFSKEVGHLLKIRERSVIVGDAAKVVSSLHDLLNKPFLEELKDKVKKNGISPIFECSKNLLHFFELLIQLSNFLNSFKK